MKRRCRVPESWKQLPPRRRLVVFEKLLAGNESEALRLALNIPRRIWRKFHESDQAQLLHMCKWADLKPGTTPHFETLRQNGLLLHAPGAGFHNGTCLEFPISDEYLQGYLDGGDPESLLLLFATLWREAAPDGTLALQREDARTPLHSRAEVKARAERLKGLPLAYQIAAMLYFVGVKEMVSRQFGPWLFEQPDENEEEAQPPATRNPPPEGDPLGWWGLYMDKAAGDPAKLQAILHSNFLEFCIMEMRQRKQMQDMEVRQRMASPGWGKNDNP